MDIEIIKSLAKKEGKKVKDFLALAMQNDPFYIKPSEINKAKWLLKIWKKEGEPTKHPRGFHYRIMDKRYKMHNGAEYINSENCWNYLKEGYKYARLLGLIPYESVLDHQNPKAEETGNFAEHEGINYDNISYEGIENFNEDKESEEEFIERVIEDKATDFTISFNPDLLQTFYIEIWAEKSAIIPEHIAREFNATLRPSGSGEFSLDMCYKALIRAKELKKDLFVFVLSDFDPKGNDMPKSIARKIEYMANEMGVTAFVKQIALLKEQCIRYKLPSVPAKKPKTKGTGARAYITHTEIFNNAMGRQSTEINALMERHEKDYSKEIYQSITPFFDDEMGDKIWELKKEINDAIEEEIREIIEENKKQIIEVSKKIFAVMEEKKILEERQEQEIEEFNEKWDLNTLEEKYNNLTKINSQEIIEALDYEMPKAEIEYPNDILLDTNKDYFKQIEQYKKFDVRSKGNGY